MTPPLKMASELTELESTAIKVFESEMGIDGKGWSKRIGTYEAGLKADDISEVLRSGISKIIENHAAAY